jgi:hypothetical protein
MFKKTILAVAMITVASLAHAKETITVINPSNKASPATVFAKSYEDALRKNGKYDVEFYQASSCADADSKYKSTKNAVMVYNADVAIAAKNKDVSCEFSATPNNTTLITKSYLKFCRKPGNKKGFGDEPTTVGIASVILSDGLFEDLNGGKRKLRGVPYSGSKTVLAAVLAGDIDYGIIGAGVVNEPEKRGEIECVYDYDPRSPKFIGNTFKGMKVPTLPIIQMIHTNGNGGVKKAVEAAGQDKDFLASIEQNGFADTKSKSIAGKDVNSVREHVDNVYNHYWKKK